VTSEKTRLLGIFLVLSWEKSIQGLGVKTGVENLKKLKNKLYTQGEIYLSLWLAKGFFSLIVLNDFITGDIFFSRLQSLQQLELLNILGLNKQFRLKGRFFGMEVRLLLLSIAYLFLFLEIFPRVKLFFQQLELNFQHFSPYLLKKIVTLRLS